MRCHLKTLIQTLVGLLILTCMYISMRRAKETEPELEPMNAAWLMGNYSSEKCSQENQEYIPCLRALVRVLAGEISPQQKYLTVGLSSVKRKKENYLLQTLHSIFNQSSEKELAEMVVVVLLADFDLHWVQQTLISIKNQFSARLVQGQLVVIHADQENYPPLTGLKRNFNDAPDRVSFRSKQNVDYAFLVDFSARLSKYYIMLEDDVSCSKGFLSSIRGHINSKGSLPWVTLEFSKLGYIGKLYHSKDLSRLAHFLFLFYQEMPCDFLLSHFRTLLMQDKVIRFQPSLFQHMGTYSSFKGTYNHLKDDDFNVNPADNPPASVYTDIKAFKNHDPDQAYSQGSNYFWGVTPINKGNFFLMAFEKPAMISRIVIQTGQDGKDTLQSAEVELGESVLKTSNGVECTEIHNLGILNKGYFELENIHQTLNRSVLCLKIRVTASQLDWVIIRKIQIWLKK
ncbi:alpha-1,3-mannosyl-glycoprotein 4-beta-N-acetylglucosaminyltransferase C isoform X2 [Silurus meridionalis]|nr:alpha-1,3-mannosyl-glycoprotein 4-beta-N-acetylglucosaminyltransferase C isoform X2 [Silurus meridionalis]XP_046725723.1 alpha-1,3-mannosyl-glycoprotein 4-beta-N-acetylglucosaminyltransferase C isoform X2 [Silurus meridionalis]XP_046725724.1 alpha-1,3-mannosyl-glycoprotein 4-beta-N-acetylglucosaminyltransferase C isoform X2 [Silurus meridionalis]XP_046725725.1 alpha-1,3-mannosyl-glycoprotein 4-beta-N-acetylglucosaminyltransferase C isoform X2 [Silurus meridionalis]